MTKKLTIAEKLEALKSMVESGATFADGTTVAEFLDDRIEKSVRKSNSTSGTSKRAKESAERRQAIFEAVKEYVAEKKVDMVGGFQIVERTGFTSGQVSSALVALAKEGKLVGHENAVSTDKGHKVKGYEVVG